MSQATELKQDLANLDAAIGRKREELRALKAARRAVLKKLATAGAAVLASCIFPEHAATVGAAAVMATKII